MMKTDRPYHHADDQRDPMDLREGAPRIDEHANWKHHTRSARIIKTCFWTTRREILPVNQDIKTASSNARSPKRTGTAYLEAGST